jgi:hypothetical protein
MGADKKWKYKRPVDINPITGLDWNDPRWSNQTWNEDTGTWTQNKTFAESLGNMAGSLASKGFVQKPIGFLLDSLVNSPVRSGLIGMGGLGLMGYGGSKLFNWLSGKRGRKVSPTRAGGLTGLIGLLTGVGLNRYAESQKTASFDKTAFMNSMLDPSYEIKAQLARDYTLSFNEKEELAKKVDNLDPQEASQLANILSSAGGAAIGMIIAKFLLKLGFGGQILMAVAGGHIGRSLFAEGRNELDINSGNLYSTSLNM